MGKTVYNREGCRMLVMLENCLTKQPKVSWNIYPGSRVWPNINCAWWESKCGLFILTEANLCVCSPCVDKIRATLTDAVWRIQHYSCAIHSHHSLLETSLLGLKVMRRWWEFCSRSSSHETICQLNKYRTFNYHILTSCPSPFSFHHFGAPITLPYKAQQSW